MMNTKKQRNKLILAVLLTIAGAIFLIVGMEQYRAAPVYYISPEDDGVELYRADGKYYLNDIELERVNAGWWEGISNFGKGFIPGCPYFIPAGLGLVFGLRLVAKAPPPFLWGSILFGRQGKEVNDGKISLRQAPGGVIAIRSWGVNKQGVLRSTAVGTEWESAILEADVTPLVGGWHGIYAYRLGTNIDDAGGCDVEGVVSLSGHITGHKDSLLRAQKCTVLVLLIEPKKTSLKPLLEQRYKCPVVVTSNIKHTLQNWILSQEGIFWLGHNAKLISGKLQDKFERDIEELPAYQKFGGES